MNHKTMRFLHDKLDWNLLRTYLVIVQEGSLSRAAARLYVTQPAVSQALKRLEESLDQKLIDRNGPYFALTPTGQEVFQIASDIYSNAARLNTDLDSHAINLTGSARILSISGFFSPAYDQCLAEFHAMYPRIDVRVDVMRSSEIISSLLQGTATAGLAICKIQNSKLASYTLISQRYALFCGRHHRLFGHKVGLEQLLREDFVTFNSDQLGDSLSPIAIFRDQRGFSGRIVASSSSLEEVRRLIFAGYGIGCLPEHTVVEDLEKEHLWRLPPEEGVVDVDVNFLWHKSRKMNAAGQAFVHTITSLMDRYPMRQRIFN